MKKALQWRKFTNISIFFNIFIRLTSEWKTVDELSEKYSAFNNISYIYELKCEIFSSNEYIVFMMKMHYFEKRIKKWQQKLVVTLQ